MYAAVSTVAILPIKDFASAKSRLADVLPSSYRRTLAEAMYSDVVRAIRHAASIDHMLVVTGDLTAAAIADHDNVTIVEDHGTTHSESAAQGLEVAITGGADRALVIAGDCPLLQSAELEALLAHPAAGRRSVLIVPDRHGTGTNALVLTPPDALTPAFGEGSCARHLRLAEQQGAAPEVVPVPGLALDVDSGEDLAQLRTILAEVRGGAAHTRGLLAQLDRSLR